MCGKKGEKDGMRERKGLTWVEKNEKSGTKKSKGRYMHNGSG